jgi:integrating conjugative element membrane protein (TIGR03747 family)
MAQQSTSSAPARPVNRGPVSILLSATLATGFAIFTGWMLGITVELVGMYLIWPNDGVDHAARLVQDDLLHLADHPHCAMSPDTTASAQAIADRTMQPFVFIGALKFVKAHSGPVTEEKSAKRSILLFLRELAKLVLIAIYIAQHIAVRLLIMLFAAPLFALLTLLAVVDGLVRRDLRKWTGARESSFVYHYAKKLTGWGLTSGMAVYLAWPFGGIDPVATVLLLSAFAAWTLSVTTASFKKYL